MPLPPPHVTRYGRINADPYNQLIDAAGMYARSTGENVFIDPAVGVLHRRRSQGRSHVWVQLVTAGTPNGQYKCIVGKPKTDVEFDPASDGAEFAFFDYTLPEGETFDGYFVNQAEENKTPHWLDAGGHYPGWIECIANDGKPVILGHVFDSELCPDEEE